MHPHPKRIGILLFTLFTIQSARSAEPPDTASVRYRLNPVIITATKIQMVQQNVAASVSVLDESDLKIHPTHSVFDAVQLRVPGLYVTEWGMMGFGAAGSAAGKISMRGVGGGSNSCMLILRDGRPDFMGLMGCTIADEFSSDGVERIEVIRGPGSFLYGTNAIGGVINIIPKRIRKNGFETHLSAGYGEFGSKTLTASHGGKTGSVDYFLTANTRNTDGHRSDANSYYRGNHYTVHIGYQINLNSVLEFNGNSADICVNDPGPKTAPLENARYDILRYGGDVNWIQKSRFGDTHIKLHANFGKHSFYDGWKSNDRTTGFMAYQNIRPWAGQTATIGFDSKRYGGDAKDASSDYGTIFITEYAPYVHIQQVFLKNWIASAGARLEHHSLYGTETLPKAGLVYHPFNRTGIRISASKGFRSPSIRELYFWMPANDELKPDRLWNYEAGFSQTVGSTMTIDATVFKAEGSNLIQLQASPPKWTNSGKYTHTGYELAWSWIPLSNLETGATWSKADLNRFAFNSPGKKLTANIHGRLGPASLMAEFLMVKDWKGLTTVNRQDVYPTMKDYTVVNLSARISVFRGLGLKCQLRNVLDEKYEAMYGYPMPGRNWMMEMEYGF
jgi:outer membrane receptor protein involved in Fe transport